MFPDFLTQPALADSYPSWRFAHGEKVWEDCSKWFLWGISDIYSYTFLQGKSIFVGLYFQSRTFWQMWIGHVLQLAVHTTWNPFFSRRESRRELWWYHWYHGIMMLSCKQSHDWTEYMKATAVSGGPTVSQKISGEVLKKLNMPREWLRSVIRQFKHLDKSEYPLCHVTGMIIYKYG